jgi:hypothetical protein
MKRAVAITFMGSLFLVPIILFQDQGLGRTDPPEEKNRMRDAFAADRDFAFDSARAMKYLTAICDLGQRISGTAAMKKQQELIQKHFEGLGAHIELQNFQAKQKSQSHPTDMTNIIVSWHPQRARRIILCSHYDTRPIADQEPDARKWHKRFLSANDGPSGVALLMELGSHMKDLKTTVGVDFVFFDGEEYVFEPQTDLYFFGSEHFASNYRSSKPRERYIAAVLLDMIAGKDAQFPIEQMSWFNASGLVKDLWQIAAEQKCTAFQPNLGPSVRDDHLALNKAGIPAVDIIDFSYPHWHRLTDVPANCSAGSMLQVARVLMVWIQQLK